MKVQPPKIVQRDSESSTETHKIKKKPFWTQNASKLLKIKFTVTRSGCSKLFHPIILFHFSYSIA